MTVRTAELAAAILLALASVALMVKSTELHIGWVKGSGPGGGAWPFWLSAGMLLTCIITAVRWFLRATPESRNEEPFMTRKSVHIVGLAVGGLVFLLAATHVIGIYFAILFFLFFFLRVMGSHSWPATTSIMVLVPVTVFVFFEWALRKPLPKGYTEPLFYPIYALIY